MKNVCKIRSESAISAVHCVLCVDVSVYCLVYSLVRVECFDFIFSSCLCYWLPFCMTFCHRIVLLFFFPPSSATFPNKSTCVCSCISKGHHVLIITSLCCLFVQFNEFRCRINENIWAKRQFLFQFDFFFAHFLSSWHSRTVCAWNHARCMI